MSMKISLSDEEQSLVRHLAGIYDKGGRMLGVTAIPIPDGMDARWRDRTLARFANYGFISYDSTDTFIVHSFVLGVADKLDNPPQPDYMRELKEWAVASKWRVAIIAITIVLPLIVQWVEMIKTVLKWIGVAAVS